MWEYIILICLVVFIVVINLILCVFVVLRVCFCIFINGFLVFFVVFDILIGGLLYFIYFSGFDLKVVVLEGYVIVFVLLLGVGNIGLVMWDCYIVVSKFF